MRRIVLAAAVASALAGVLPAVARPPAPVPAYPVHVDESGQGWVTVPVENGGQVTIRLTGGSGPLPTTVRLTARIAGDAPSSASASAGPVTAADSGTDDEAATYPAAPSREPGTAVTAAGGNCDGYLAHEATISPLRVAVDRHGTVFWIDRDVTVARHGSALLRRLDASGRVRTLGSVVPPNTHRFNKTSAFWEHTVHVVPDDRGGAYVNTGWQRADPYYPDEPASGLIAHFDATGKRTVVAGGGERLGVDQAGTSATRARDGRPALQSWLADIDALVRDERGLFFSENPGPGLRNLVRFVNLSAETVTFYPGTPQAVSVLAGRIGTLAAQDDTYGLDTAVDEQTDRTTDASKFRFFKVPGLAIRGQVLYVWDISLWNEADSGPPGSQADFGKIEAINLGYDGRPVTANGVTVPPGQVGIVAGSSLTRGGYAGDLGPARAAAFNVNYSGYNGDIAVAADGTVYLSDTRNHRIRAVDGLGIIRTVAGNGSPGYDGERVASTTRLWNPMGLALDTRGDVLFTELENARIRRLGRDGRLSTVAGRGPYPCGAGRAPTGRTFYGGAYFGKISDVATDSRGNTYVADTSYNIVRRISPAGRIDLTIGRPTPCAAGRWGEVDPGACAEFGPQTGDGVAPSEASLGDPRHVFVDAYDNVYISDVDRVRYVNLTPRPVNVLGQLVPAGTIHTVATFPRRLVSVGGEFLLPESRTTIGALGDLAVDRRGTLYVADPLLGVIHRIGPCADTSIVAGRPGATAGDGTGDGGLATAAPVSPAGGLTYDRDRDLLYFVDRPVSTGRSRIRAVNTGTAVTTAYGRRIEPQHVDTVAGAGQCALGFTTCSYGNGGPAYQAGLSATGVELDHATRRLYFTESSNAVRAVLPNGVVAGIAVPVPEAAAPAPPIRFGRLPIPVGGWYGDGGPAQQAWMRLGRGSYGEHSGVAVGRTGDLYVADAARVRRITDADNAPLRLDSSTEPTLPRAGELFTQPLLLRDEILGNAEGGYAPRLAYDPRVGWVVVGSRGAGRGCVSWVVRDTGGASQDRPEPPSVTTVGVQGRSASGTGCALARDESAQPFVVASARRLGVVEAGVEVSASADGASWMALPAEAGRERAGQTSYLGEVAAGGAALAYRTGAASFAVVRRDTGSTVTVPAPVIAFGDVLTLKDRTLVAFVEEGPPALLGERVHRMSVAEVAGGRATVVRLAPVPESKTRKALASPPSLSVAPDGSVHLAYSDDRRIHLGLRDPAGRWRMRGTVSVRGAAVLPAVVAGPGGRAALAYYYSPVADAPARPWYAAVSLLDRTGRPGATPVVVASPYPIHRGPVCLSQGCARTRTEVENAADPFANSEAKRAAAAITGPVTAGLDRDGVLRIAYAVDPGMGGNASTGSVLATQRFCRLAHVPAGGRCLGSLDGADEPPPPDVVPPPPPGPPLSVSCSPLPPPFRGRAVNPPPGPGATFRPQPAQPLPGTGSPAAPPTQPLQPALPPGSAPAPSVHAGTAAQQATATEHQMAGQTQVGTQPGVAAEEERRVESARSFAFSRKDSPYPAVLPMWLLTAAGTGALVVARRRRPRPARASCGG